MIVKNWHIECYTSSDNKNNKKPIIIKISSAQ